MHLLPIWLLSNYLMSKKNSLKPFVYITSLCTK